MELKYFIDVHENVFQKSVLKTLKKIVEEFEFKQATVFENGGENQKVDTRIRNVQEKPLMLESDSLTEWHWINFLGASFLQVNNHYYKKRNLNIYSDVLLNINFLKYENTGHYNFHIDSGKGCNRTLSMIFLINDNYEGGNLIFKDIVNNKEHLIEKKENTLIVWPRNFLFPHAVTPVTKGVRYSIVSWTL